MKIRQPRTPVVEVNKVIRDNIEITEINLQINEQHNMELYHPLGKYSGAGVTFGARAIVKPDVDLEMAKEELISFVTETHSKMMLEEIDKLLAIIRKR
jgi:hypothetical protein